MKLETIYNDLLEIMKDDMNFEKALKLKDKLEQAIREEDLKDIKAQILDVINDLQSEEEK